MFLTTAYIVSYKEHMGIIVKRKIIILYLLIHE